MKNNFKFLVLLMLFACNKNEPHIVPVANILGKWDLESYKSSTGEIKDETYIIFRWYESGFEFLDEHAFYPRYGLLTTMSGLPTITMVLENMKYQMKY